MMIVKVLLSVYLSNNIDATPEIAKNKTLTLIRHYNESSSSPMDIIQKKVKKLCLNYLKNKLPRKKTQRNLIRDHCVLQHK